MLAPLVGWKGFAAGLALLGLAGGTSAALGIKENVLTDIKDLQDNVRGWAKDEEYQSQRPLIENLLYNLSDLASLSNTIFNEIGKADDADVTLLGNSLLSFDSTLKEVEETIKQFRQIFGGMTGLDFIRTQGLVEDIREGFDDLLELSKASKAKAEALERSQEAQALKADPREPTVEELGGNPKYDKKDSPQPTYLSEESDLSNRSKRVENMQRFLRENFDPSVPLSGVMDQPTKNALDRFAEVISTDLGISNLDGTRLEKEGDEYTLRRVYDIYRNPWKYTE